jgi:hypothetical protein
MMLNTMELPRIRRYLLICNLLYAILDSSCHRPSQINSRVAHLTRANTCHLLSQRTILEAQFSPSTQNDEYEAVLNDPEQNDGILRSRRATSKARENMRDDIFVT